MVDDLQVCNEASEGVFLPPTEHTVPLRLTLIRGWSKGVKSIIPSVLLAWKLGISKVPLRKGQNPKMH